jgi:hypothetical protein
MCGGQFGAPSIEILRQKGVKRVAAPMSSAQNKSQTKTEFV